MSEVLISEQSPSVYGLPTGSIPMSDITSLEHKIRDNSMEPSPTIMQLFVTQTYSFLTCTKTLKVLSGDGCLLKQLKLDPPHILPLTLYIQKDSFLCGSRDIVHCIMVITILTNPSYVSVLNSLLCLQHFTDL